MTAPATGTESEILRTIVGSGLHGIAIEGTDDHDEMGVFVEPPQNVTGMGPPMDSRVNRTQPEGVRSGPGDTDLVRYSLRHYLRLATKGNPTALLPLFAPDSFVIQISPYGYELRRQIDHIVSQKCGSPFLGYLLAQKLSMLGFRKRPNRPELVEKYGYDTKFAAHALRLALQGLELLSTGTLTLPIPEADHLRDIKTGRYSRDAVLREIEDVERELKAWVEEKRSPLRPEPDLEYLSRWSHHVHDRVWRPLTNKWDQEFT